ncbi:hypothetical protein [Candidatus Sordicultor fermentans]|uniref:hypothetical protein n=1 Tax=Candidatus Sordicultor fermentans TaxID=1953203 RepID=UPI0039089DD4
MGKKKPPSVKSFGFPTKYFRYDERGVTPEWFYEGSKLFKAKTFGCLIRFQAERKEPPYSPRNCHTCDATRLIMTTRGLARMLEFFPALLSWFFVFPAFFHTVRLLCEAYMAKKGYSINFAVKYKKEEARLPDYKKNPPYNPPQGRTHKKKKQALLKF